MSNSFESALQQEAVKWANDYIGKLYPELLMRLRSQKTKIEYWGIPFYCNANSGKFGYKTSNRRKAEGVVSGVPDITLAVKSGDFGGLYLEFKTDKTTGPKKTYPEPNQREWIRVLTLTGFRCEVVRNMGEFKNIITEHMEGWRKID